MSRTIKVSNTGGHVWPTIRLGLASEITALCGELEQTQWLTAEALASRQMRQLRRLLKFAVDHSPYYRERFAASGAKLDELDAPDALRTLPLLRRQDVQQAAEHFFCRDVPSDQGKLVESQTSGSTGEPVRVRKTGISQLFWYAFSMRNHAWHRFPFSARYTAIRANIRKYAESDNWGAPYVFLYRTGPAQSIPIVTPLAEQMALLRKFQPETLLVYPSNLNGLLDLWGGLPALTQIKTMGETLRDDLRERVHELDGNLSVIDAYSSEECGIIALQCPAGTGYHVMSESMIVEVLDDDDRPCAPGQTGRIVITDLHNLASPLVRYDIRDYATVGEPCACGRGLMKLDRVLGRQRNLIVKPNGDRHWPLVGFRDFRSIGPIRQYQMIQEAVDRVTVRLVTDAPLTDVQRRAMTELVQRKLGYPFTLDIVEQREDFPPQPNGKFEEFVSRL